MTRPLMIDDAFIEEWHPGYDDIKNDEKNYQEIIVEVSKDIYGSGISEQTFRRILEWKAPRVKGIIKWDEFYAYADAFEHCIAAPESKKLAILDDLYGVGAPVASTILHFAYPSEFPIIDKRTVGVLYHCGCLESKTTDQKRYPHFRSTIFRIQQQCNQRWSLRQIDRALFAYHKLILDPSCKKRLRKVNIDVSC